MKIEKARFLEFGKEAPPGSRFKGILDTESLVGWFEYTDREDAKENNKNISEHDGGFFGYTSGHSVGTFSSQGELITEKQKNSFKKQLAKSFEKNGNIFWDYVISLEDDIEAELCGLNSEKQWLNVVQHVMPKIAKEYKMDINNLHWWFDVHRNTEHPHIHLVFLEKNQTRTRGMISDQQLANTKRFFWTEISARRELEERVHKNYKEFFKDKDKSFNELVVKIDEDILKKNKVSLKELYRVLPKTGRLQYNSVHLKEQRPLIDKVIDGIVNDTPQLQKQLKDFYDKIDTLETVMNQIGGSQVSSIKEAEMKKLYERVGNLILQNYKRKEDVNLNVNITSLNNTLLNKNSNEIKNNLATLPSKSRKNKSRTIVKKKYLNKKRIAYEISQAAYDQQREIENALDELYERYERDLIS